MPRLRPLPQALQGRLFTRAQAVALGVADARPKAPDVVRLARATYQHVPAAQPGTVRRGDALPVMSLSLGADANIGAPDWDLLRVLCRRSTAVWVSHVTAAWLYGLQLPHRLSQPLIDLTALHHCFGTDSRVRLHRVKSMPALHGIRGIPVSTPGQLFVDTARYLSLRELVCLGDQLVREPYPQWEHRTEPHITLPALHADVTAQRGRRGIGRARMALERVRVGSDSPPENLMRLALIDAGLPEPHLHILLNPADRFSPTGDAGYPGSKLVIQYDGEGHFNAEQQARDQRRNAAFESAGWRVVLANRVDLNQKFQPMIRRIKEHLSRST